MINFFIMKNNEVVSTVQKEWLGKTSKSRVDLDKVVIKEYSCLFD